MKTLDNALQTIKAMESEKNRLNAEMAILDIKLKELHSIRDDETGDIAFFLKSHYLDDEICLLGTNRSCLLGTYNYLSDLINSPEIFMPDYDPAIC